MIFKIYVDAATRGQNGPSSAGVLILTQQQQFQFKCSLPEMNNHLAEFKAMAFALDCVANMAQADDTLMLNGDSKIVIDALSKGYAKHFMDELRHINTQLEPYANVIVNWIPEKQNHGAHQLAQQALPPL